MKNYSIWLDDIKLDKANILKENLEVDILIIGGGITGLNIAYELRNSNLNIALVEKNRIGHGVTAKTTGKLTFLQETIYTDLTTLFNESIAKKYLDSQILAIKKISEIIKKENIECNLENNTSFLFTNNKKDIKKIKEEKQFLEKYKIKVEEHNYTPDQVKVDYAISVKNTKVFHPLKYVYALMKLCQDKIDIYENTCITNINKEDNLFICKTNKYTIKAKKVIIACHYPFFIIPYLFPLKVHLEKSYIGAYKVNNDALYNGITPKIPTTSIRYYKNNDNVYKIILTNSHNIAFKNDDELQFKDLKNNAQYLWSNKDIITPDKLPLIGEVKNNLYIATGYNTWGMTNSLLAGLIIKDLIMGKYNIYADIFSPKRKINVGKVLNFPINLTSNAKSFISSKINKNKSWYNNKIKFLKENGKNIAIYIDDFGKEHKIYNTCPHLKCSLVFNEVEKTWDCPCHGSRFDIDGKSIEGPSNFNITYKD